jgi:hypothetical protein
MICFLRVSSTISEAGLVSPGPLPHPLLDCRVKHRLTIEKCAGICELSKDPQTGRFTRIRLKLSTPLLQYRPRSDTINTLLHEAIHAYFFITTSWKHSRGDDGTGHGAGFQLLADAVNNHGNYQVTIYHTFHDEVDSYRTHVWQCDGPCRSQPPYFGLVKRSMNRAPGKGDTWYSRHQAECGGTFQKIQEPAPTKKQLEAMSTKERAGRQKNKLDSWIKKDVKAEGQSSAMPIVIGDDDTTTRPPNDKQGVVSLLVQDTVDASTPTASTTGQKRPRVGENHNFVVQKKLLVDCPICAVRIAESDINEHLDVVHP